MTLTIALTLQAIEARPPNPPPATTLLNLTRSCWRLYAAAEYLAADLVVGGSCE